MENSYTIVWVARRRERSGVGTKRFAKEEAERLAGELNESYPAIEHKAVNTATENIAEILDAMRASVGSQETESVVYPELVARAAAAISVPQRHDAEAGRSRRAVMKMLAAA